MASNSCLHIADKNLLFITKPLVTRIINGSFFSGFLGNRPLVTRSGFYPDTMMRMCQIASASIFYYVKPASGSNVWNTLTTADLHRETITGLDNAAIRGCRNEGFGNEKRDSFLNKSRFESPFSHLPNNITDLRYKGM